MLGLERLFWGTSRSDPAQRMPSAEIVKTEGYSPEFVEARTREVNHVLVAIQESARVIAENCLSARTELPPVTDGLFSDVRSVMRQLKEHPGNFGRALFLLRSLEAGADLFDLVARKSILPLTSEKRIGLVQDLVTGIQPLIEGFADLSQDGREVVDNIRLEALLNTIKELANTK